jgi:hypothetical protein
MTRAAQRSLAIGVPALALVVLVVGWLVQRSSPRVGELFEAAARQADPGGRVALDSLAAPAPVARYLRHVLREGQRPIRVARLRQAGELRTGLDSEDWLPFTARHVVAPPATGFVWDARIDLGWRLLLSVRDAYVDGRGSGQASLLSVLPLDRESGRTEMDAGALHRYLAEAVWYPTALLPSDALRWTAMDATRARATLTHAGTTVSLDFWFNDDGEVAGIHTPGRWGRFDEGFRQAPWEGHFRAYVERDGMRVPSEGEVGWYAGTEWECVWRGRVLEARYDLAP